MPQLPTALSPVCEMSGVLRITLFPHCLGVCVTLKGPRAHLWGQLCSPHPKIPWRLEMKERGARIWLQVLGEVTQQLQHCLLWEKQGWSGM